MKKSFKFLFFAAVVYVADIFQALAGNVKSAWNIAAEVKEGIDPEVLRNMIEMIFALVGTFIANLIIKWLERKFPDLMDKLNFFKK